MSEMIGIPAHAGRPRKPRATRATASERTLAKVRLGAQHMAGQKQITPTHLVTFQRYHRPLRGLMIDNQPWFVARDIGLLMGHRNIRDRQRTRLAVVFGMNPSSAVFGEGHTQQTRHLPGNQSPLTDQRDDAHASAL